MTSEPRQDDEDTEHEADGLAYRVRCGSCNETFEILDADPRYEVVECDMCGHKAKVRGDY